MFFLFIALANYGQNTGSKVIQGKVVVPNTDVAGITIQNTSTRRATITDLDGNFSIRARLGDTLIFSAVQIKRKVVPVSKALLGSTFIQIHLEEFVNELREVTVQPFGLSGDIEKDVTRLKLEKDISAEALDLPNADVRIITQSENKLNDADHGKFVYVGFGITINVNKILNRLSGRTKMLKERVKLDAEYDEIKELEAKFLDSLILAELHIPENRFYDFVRFCESDSQFEGYAQGYDELRLWEFLKTKSIAYRNTNGLE